MFLATTKDQLERIFENHCGIAFSLANLVIETPRSSDKGRLVGMYPDSSGSVMPGATVEASSGEFSLT